MCDIILSESFSRALISLHSTARLLDRTQSRLTYGLVASAIDDAVAFSPLGNLSDHTTDIGDYVDRRISSLSAAVTGITIADAILKQMKGIIDSVHTADIDPRTTLTSQFNGSCNMVSVNSLPQDIALAGGP